MDLPLIKVTAGQNSKQLNPPGAPFGRICFCFRTFAVDNYSYMSGALHIQPNDACNF